MSKNIYQKLLEIQNELNCPKNQFNKFGNYIIKPRGHLKCSKATTC